jgi:hypothetical protein
VSWIDWREDICQQDDDPDEPTPDNLLSLPLTWFHRALRFLGIFR